MYGHSFSKTILVLLWLPTTENTSNYELPFLKIQSTLYKGQRMQ